MFCSNCGKEIDDKAVICTGCGCKVKKSGGVSKDESGGVSVLGVLGSIFIPLFGLIFGIVSFSRDNARAGKVYLVIWLLRIICEIAAVRGGMQ